MGSGKSRTDSCKYVLFSFSWAKSNSFGKSKVNVNPAYQAGELRYALEKVEVKALVAAKTFRNTDLIDILSKLVPQLDRQGATDNVSNGELRVTSDAVPSLERVVVLSDEPQNRSFSNK